MLISGCTSYQRSFLVYGEFLGKPNVQGQLRMLLSLFFVYMYSNILVKCLTKVLLCIKENNYAYDKFKITFKFINFSSICSYLSQNHRQTQVKTV